MLSTSGHKRNDNNNNNETQPHKYLYHLLLLLTSIVNEPPVAVAHRVSFLDDPNKTASRQIEVHRLRPNKVLAHPEQAPSRICLSQMRPLTLALADLGFHILHTPIHKEFSNQ